MTNSTSERSERLLQQLEETPAGERIRMKCGAADLRSVITDLLSLLDSEAAASELAREAYDFYMGPQACGDFTCACGDTEHCGMCEMRQRFEMWLKRQPVEPLAATAMLDLCVEKVKEYLTDCRDEERGIIEAIASQLQSLTLDNQQPVKTESCCISALVHSREKERKQK